MQHADHKVLDTIYYYMQKKMGVFSHVSWVYFADRCSPVSAPACRTAALEASQNLGSSWRRQPQRRRPNLCSTLGKSRALSPQDCRCLKREQNQRTTPMRTGALSVRTEESCSVVTSVPKFFIWLVTSPLWMSPPGERQIVSRCSTIKWWWMNPIKLLTLIFFIVLF